MDLLFKRYASPYIFLDGIIESLRFSDFIDELITMYMKEESDTKMWELYLHHAFLEISYDEYLKLVKYKQSIKQEKSSFETTIKESKEILNDFIPREMEV